MKDLNDRQKGLITAQLATLFLAGTGPCIKFIPLSLVELSCFRSILAMIALGAFMKFMNASFKLNIKQCGLCWLMGLCMGLHWITYFEAMRVSSILVGIIALHTYPIFSVLLEPIFFKERKLTLRDILLSLMMFFGIWLIIPKMTLDNDITLGLFWGCLSALLLAARGLIYRHQFQSENPLTVTFYQLMIPAFLFLPFVSNDIVTMPLSAWAVLLAFGTLFTALPHTLMSASIKYLPLKTSALIGCLQPVYGGLIAYLLLNEIPTFWTLVGGGVIILVAIIESGSFFSKPSKEQSNT
jgi:drug/metabolite transporter (DMT)-like permease